MFLSGIGVSKVSCVSHEHAPLVNVDMIEKGTACNVSCIERHVERRDTRVSQVLQGEGLMGDMTQNKSDERTRRLSNISPTLPETEIATFAIFMSSMITTREKREHLRNMALPPHMILSLSFVANHLASRT